MINENNFDTSFNQLFFCEMKIGDIEIIPENIVTLNIREWVLDIAPRMYCIMNDDGMLSEVFNLTDNMKITLLLGKHPLDENMLEFEFQLQDKKLNLVADNKYSMVSFTAILNVDNLYHPIKNRCFKNLSSKQVLNKIADECGLNFKTKNGFNVADNMNWYQINQDNYSFIKYINERSFKDDDMILSYCDINKNLNMTSLKLESNKQEAKTAIYDQENYTKFDFDDDTDKNTIWFNTYDAIDLNGCRNKINNYGIKYNYYDLENNNENILNFDSTMFTELSFKDSSDIVNHYNFGIQNNVHDNYNKGIAQNSYYRSNFFSFVMSLNINSLIEVNLFDKINVQIPSMPTYGQNELNDILSGKYLISGIVYSIGKSKMFQKQIILSRDGMNKSNFT